MTDMTDREKRAAFLKMLADGGVTAGDRALADEALDRAMVVFMRNKGGEDCGPYTRADLERVCGSNSAVMILIAEAELAIAAARVLERERCARIAEKWTGSKGLRSEQLSEELAKKIRQP